MADETTFFQYEDVTVTNSRFIVASQTFAMSNITSVKALKQEPSRAGPVICIVLGIFFLLSMPAFGVLLFGAGALWMVLQKTTYHVMLTTAGGETSAVSSKQREYIDKIVSALNNAIVARG